MTTRATTGVTIGAMGRKRRAVPITLPPPPGPCGLPRRSASAGGKVRPNGGRAAQPRAN
jgi:hypothetical protein